MTPTPIKDRPDYEPNCYRCRERVGKPRAGVTGLCENHKDAEILSLANEEVMLRARIAELERERKEFLAGRETARNERDEADNELADARKTIARCHSIIQSQRALIDPEEHEAIDREALEELAGCDKTMEDRDRLQERLDQLAAYGAGNVEELLNMLEGLRSQADEAQADALFAVSQARRATERLEPLRAEMASDTKECRLAEIYQAQGERDAARAENARLAELALDAKEIIQAWGGIARASLPPSYQARMDAWLSNWQGGAVGEKADG